ncbi:MAG: Rieske (2Fe-2S) protein, partial [Elusimicrobia bacterium]|nr:Rieske (2Fe-2S) protein [Elusimicrobiota bacterium]
MTALPSDPANPQSPPPSAPPKPAAPAKPAAPVKRRDFLWLGWGALVSFFGASAAATARFFFPNVIYEPSQKFNAGQASSFDVGVSTKWLNVQRVWV